MNPSWLSELLEKDIFSRHSFYKGVRHNHRPHGIGAMARLGASQEYIEGYLSVLNESQSEYKPDEELTEPAEVDRVKSDNIKDYRGKNNGIYHVKKLYEDLLKSKYNGDMIAMLKGEYPELIEGPLLSAFHGIITVAYGVIGNSPNTILEGLVFANNQYSPLLLDEPNNPKNRDTSKFGKGTVDVMDAFTKIHENKDLLAKIKSDATERVAYTMQNGLSDEFGYVVAKNHGIHFLDAADDLKLPEFFKPEEESMDQLMQLHDWFLNNCFTLYLKNEHINDFFVLHSVTGTWASKMVLPHFDFKSALIGFRAVVAAVFAVYAYQGGPALTRTAEEFVKTDVTQEAWDAVIKSAFDHHYYEPHVFKVIQIAYEMYKEGKYPEMAKTYLGAAIAAKDHFYTNGNGITFSSVTNADIRF